MFLLLCTTNWFFYEFASTNNLTTNFLTTTDWLCYNKTILSRNVSISDPIYTNRDIIYNSARIWASILSFSGLIKAGITNFTGYNVIFSVRLTHLVLYVMVIPELQIQYI